MGPAKVVLPLVVHRQRVACGSPHGRSSHEAGVHVTSRPATPWRAGGSPEPPAPAATYQDPV